jgi:hypothetical protein
MVAAESLSESEVKQSENMIWDKETTFQKSNLFPLISISLLKHPYSNSSEEEPWTPTFSLSLSLWRDRQEREWEGENRGRNVM